MGWRSYLAEVARRRSCGLCGGTGQIVHRGEEIPYDALDERDRAEVMVNGGIAYRTVKGTCPSCGGSGRRRIR